jgi:hypothetical protein
VSAHQTRDIEVQLNPSVFRRLFRLGPFQPSIDWFASASKNAQLTRFYSWSDTSMSSAEGFDAFSFYWGNEYGYMLPPFNLLPCVIRKIRQDGARVLLIHPQWPGGHSG